MLELLTEPLELFLMLFPAIVLLLWALVILNLLKAKEQLETAHRIVRTEILLEKKRQKYQKSTKHCGRRQKSLLI